jgi:hypothetical protein
VVCEDTEFYRNIVIARNAAILMRTLVAIVVRLLRRLKKPSRNDDFSRPITAKISILYNTDHGNELVSFVAFRFATGQGDDQD